MDTQIKDLIGRTMSGITAYWDRAANGVTLLALHETDALKAHWAAMEERYMLARRARSTGEMIRDQLDLIPESRNRVLHDQDVRRQLWRGLVRDLTSPLQKLG